MAQGPADRGDEATEPIPVAPPPILPVDDAPLSGPALTWPALYRRLRRLAAATVAYVAAAALWWTLGSGAEAGSGPTLAFAAIGVALTLADLIGLFVLASAD